MAPDATFLGRDAADLTDPPACAARIEGGAWDAVINAAAYTAVDKAETEEATAHLVNGEAPAAMARACAAAGIPFVHISTDYVFDGSGTRPPGPRRTRPGPLGAYGRTKLAGEDGVRAACGAHAILRTSWVFSAHGGNFVKTMLRLGAERDALTIVADQRGRPHARRRHRRRLPDAGAQPARRQTFRHVPFSPAARMSAGPISPARFLRLRASTATVTDIPTTAFPTPAARPANSRMDCSDIARDHGISRPRMGRWLEPGAGRSGCGLSRKDLHMTQRKGIILAGGSGTRLYPITMAVSKQLLPIYDKPMIYYPLSVLMLSGIREIAIITTPAGPGSVQAPAGRWLAVGHLASPTLRSPRPTGWRRRSSWPRISSPAIPPFLVLGDNIFFGHGLPELLHAADAHTDGATVFGYRVADPERYGVVDFDESGTVRGIIEKPEVPPSNHAVTGLYFVDGTAPERARKVEPSARGELEITTLLEMYLHDGLLKVQRMGRGYAWLDTGTHGSLLDAGNLVRTLELRQGMQSGSPEEIAYDQGWIGKGQLSDLAEVMKKNRYGTYLKGLL